MPNHNQTWVGIDFNQDKINIHIQPSHKNFQVDNNEQGIIDLITKLIPLKAQSIIVQRNQGKEASLTHQLIASAFPLLVINSDHAKKLLLEINIGTKTSKVRAQDLASLGMHTTSTTAKLSKQLKSQLKSLSTLDSQLQEMMTDDKLKLEKIEDTSKESLSKHIIWLEEQLSDNNQKLQSLIDKIEDQQEVRITTKNQDSFSNSQSQNQSSQQPQKATKSYRGQVYQEVQTVQHQLSNQAIPTKKITKHYRGQSYEVEVPDYVALAAMKKAQMQNNQ